MREKGRREEGEKREKTREGEERREKEEETEERGREKNKVVHSLVIASSVMFLQPNNDRATKLGQWVLMCAAASSLTHGQKDKSRVWKKEGERGKGRSDIGGKEKRM